MDQEVSSVSAELFFLLHKFLAGIPLSKTLQQFQQELSDLKLLPKRTDWLGQQHDSTIEDMERQFPHIRPDYLLQLCCRASSNTDKTKSLLTLKRHHSSDGVEYNFTQLCDYVRRQNLLPCRNIDLSCNIVNSIRGQEISGPLSRRWIVSPRIYVSLQFQRRTLGHLSAVYCLLFDHSGRYIITGADDLLIKLWSSRTGRLMASFRGASSEITDIAINLENTLLAAGSVDRILRVWDLQTGVPIAVLTGHTGMITSVNFCPSPFWNFQYLITTSTDGSVCFWAYTNDNGKVNFRAKPTVYQERMRPGQAQMICSSFSPGGTFLATGSADHHVRVYYMKGDEGPHRILEIEAHTDRVDSIQWAHSGLKFLSGSKDGTAIIWSFECQQWKSMYIHMGECNAASSAHGGAASRRSGDDARTSTSTAANAKQQQLKVTMVSWDKTDQWVITAVSDYTLKIWNARSGQLYKVLSGHTDEIYVLESHPHDRHVVLSAGHDGQLFVWDIFKGEVLSKFLNTIENQGYGAIFDAKWSPDGNVISASDSHGNLLVFGFGTGSGLFERLPKELFFHTDYRPLVRDANNYVLDEQTQVAPHLMPPPFLVDIDGNPYPPVLQRLVPGREHCKNEQLTPSIVIGNEGEQEVIQVVAEENQRLENRIEPEDDETLNNTRGARTNGRRTRDEGIRQSTGDWQSDPNIKWKKHILVPPLSSCDLRRCRENVEAFENLEMQEYKRQLSQRPHMINTSAIKSTGLHQSTSKTNERKKSSARPSASYRTRNVNRGVFLLTSEESAESEGSESTGYSDWVDDEDAREESRKKRTRRRQVSYNSDSDGDREKSREEASEEEEEEASPERILPPPPQKVRQLRKKNVSEAYRTSEWLTEVRPRKSPYYPQMGDELVYFPQGHHLYLDVVKIKKIYETNTKSLPWAKVQLRSYEYVKVMNIQYEIKPPRVCSLKLALLDEEGRLSGKIFAVKYHDMPDVLDFFVLKQHFDMAMSRDWQEGNGFRCMIDDGWWTGEVVSKSTASEEFPDSPFLCYEIKWDNGELERMSPWDMEPIDENRAAQNLGEALPVLEEELQTILYQPTPHDWPGSDINSVTVYILAGISKVMELAIAEPFLVPVDLNVYPTYAMIIQYPIDLSTIKARFENKFYRRVTAAQFDIRHLAINAEKFNERHSIIVKHARILTELCLRIVKQCTLHLDVTTIYHQLVDTYDSSDTEMDVEIAPSGSGRKLRSLPSRYLKDPGDWKNEGEMLLDAICECEDSVPFRKPVNISKYTDYHQVVTEPMDLSTVRERLQKDFYQTPYDFQRDMKLIVTNSRQYNTNQRSRIYVMTVRLAAILDEHINKLISKWKLARRRSDVFKSSRSSNRLKNSNRSENNTSSPSSSTSKDVDVELTSPLATNTPNCSTDSKDVKIKEACPPREMTTNTDTDSDDDDTPLKKLIFPRIGSSGNCNTPSKLHNYSKPPRTNSSSSSSDTGSSDSSSSSSSGEDSESNKCVDSDHSEGSVYKPTTRSRGKESGASSDEDDEVDHSSEHSVDSDDQPLNRSVVARSKKRSSSFNQSSSRASKKKRTTRRPSPGYSEDSDDEDKVLTSVSSRGRVRKLNPRVTALMKK